MLYGLGLVRAERAIRLHVWLLVQPGHLQLSRTCHGAANQPPATADDRAGRRRWWINVESAIALSTARQASSALTTATVPAGTSFPAGKTAMQFEESASTVSRLAALALPHINFGLD